MGSNTANTKMLWDELKERIQIKHKKEIPISLEELCSVDVISSHWTEILPSYVIPGSAKTRWSGGLGTISVEVNVQPAWVHATDYRSVQGVSLPLPPGALPDSFQPCINSHGCTNDKTTKRWTPLHSASFFYIKYSTSSPGIQEHYLCDAVPLQLNVLAQTILRHLFRSHTSYHF